MSKPKVLLGIPMLGTINAEFFKSIMLLEDTENIQIGLEVNSMTYLARNRLAAKAIDNNFDYLVMVDSDMKFDPLMINKLVADAEEGRDFVAGLFFRRVYPTSPVILNTLEWERKEDTGIITFKADTMRNYPKDQIFEIAGSGFGAVCIRTKVITEVANGFALPPFDPLPLLTEDYSFCWKLGKLGKKMYCDSRIKLGHVGQMVFDEEVYLNQQ